jgi:hypothetical protein
MDRCTRKDIITSSSKKVKMTPSGGSGTSEERKKSSNLKGRYLSQKVDFQLSILLIIPSVTEAKPQTF